MLSEEHNTNSDRLEYLFLNLVGQIVQVTTIDGTVAEGIFVSRTDPETAEEDAGLIVSCSRFLSSEQHKPLDAAMFSQETKLFRYNDIVQVQVQHLKLRSETPGVGHVHSYRGEHDLKLMDWAGDGTEELLESGKSQPGEWDQFKANERFGVTSTYSEDLYTTKLDRSKISKEQLEEADRIAKQIESSSVRNAQHHAERMEVMTEDMDEGQLFSDVAREKGKKPFGSPAAPAPSPPRKAEPKTAATKRPTAAAAAAAATATNVAPTSVTTPSPAAAPVAAEEPAATASPMEPLNKSDFNPNPAAAPFVPSRPIINDYLKTIADAISANPECYESTADWPGEVDHYDKDDSNYSQQQQQQSGYGGGPHMQGGYGGGMGPVSYRGGGPQVMHHHHHHQIPLQQPQLPPQQQYGPGPNNGTAPHYQMGGNPHHMPPQHYMDPGMNNGGNMMGGGNPMAGGGPMPPPQSQPGPSTRIPQQRSTKGSQPQQPVSVSSTMPMQAQGSMGAQQPPSAPPSQPPQQQPSPPQQQQPPSAPAQQQQPSPPQQQQPAAVPAVDSSAGDKQPAKKLRRGGAAAAPRADAADGPQNSKKGGK